jgi:hypothetical protein
MKIIGLRDSNATITSLLPISFARVKIAVLPVVQHTTFDGTCMIITKATTRNHFDPFYER